MEDGTEAITGSGVPIALRCIVKLGGAAITCKNQIEQINEESLSSVASQLREAMMLDESSSGKVLGMDWSRRHGLNSECFEKFDELGNASVSDRFRFIVVHGAGSFGHFQASKSGVHKGGLHLPLVKAGFVATRISVTSLNLEIVRALAREGIPSIGMPPFACGWSTYKRNRALEELNQDERDKNHELVNSIAFAGNSQVTEAITSGFVPVLHGDAVFDSSLGCTILSGDVIIRHLAEEFKPDYVVFLTDVLGVYDRPPSDPKAVLLREIAVDKDGKWSIQKPVLNHSNSQVEFTVAAHDTTGGMVTKISEAALIAKLGIDVYIVKAGTEHSLKALKGQVNGKIPDDWIGTAIRSSKRS